MPNHTSDQHPWFRDALAGRDARAPRLVRVGRPEARRLAAQQLGLAASAAPAWTLDEPTGQYYLHNFLAEQPDLNWWNEDVRDAFDEILRFWFDRGIAGFRIDVCHMIVKDARAARQPAADARRPPASAGAAGQRQVYNARTGPRCTTCCGAGARMADDDDPPRDAHGRDLRARPRAADPVLRPATTSCTWPSTSSSSTPPFEAGALRTIVEGIEAVLPAAAWPVWTGSNHDVGRLPTRWAGGDPTGRAWRC